MMPEQSIKELDALGASFSTLLQTVHEARAETSAAYVGAIRALARRARRARCLHRRPLGAGQRRSRSRSAGRWHVPTNDLEVLRLGALLHDIGKIGISDAILAQARPADRRGVRGDQEASRRSARRSSESVPFLEPHLPIVELHHERPDGRGYPHGLRGDEIPLLARIVHVADAFDAMTTARAYRSGRPATEALGELWRHAGTDFDVPSLQGLASVVARMDAAALVALAAPTLEARRSAGPPRSAPVIPPRAPCPFERRVLLSAMTPSDRAGRRGPHRGLRRMRQPSCQRRGRDDPRRRGGPRGADASARSTPPACTICWS